MLHRDKMSLSSKSVAVITGAASGIGRALAVRLAEEKIAGIAISDVNENGLNETFELVEKLNVPVSAHIVDVSKLEEVERFKAEVLEKHRARDAFDKQCRSRTFRKFRADFAGRFRMADEHQFLGRGLRL